MISVFLFITGFSALGLSVMVFYRAWELKEGKVFFSPGSTSGEATEGRFSLTGAADFLEECSNEHAPRLYRYVCRHGKKALERALSLPQKNLVLEKFSTFTDAVKGRNFITTRRESKSSFLKTVAEHKEKIRGEK